MGGGKVVGETEEISPLFMMTVKLTEPQGYLTLTAIVAVKLRVCPMCAVELTSEGKIDRHEDRIYQPGYTPAAIRHNITRNSRSQ